MRREFPNRIKAQIVYRSLNEQGSVCCEGCGLVLGKKRYDIDHTIPDALMLDKSRELTKEDGRLLGVDCCHRPKTVDDVGRIAKAKRQAAKHLGIRKPSRWHSKWKKRLDGTVVLR